jgi:hypothetical protein
MDIGAGLAALILKRFLDGEVCCSRQQWSDDWKIKETFGIGLGIAHYWADTAVPSAANLVVVVVVATVPSKLAPRRLSEPGTAVMPAV